MHSKQITRTLLICSALALLTIVAFAVLPAEAAPGGLIKEAVKNIWVQIGLGILAVIFAPVIIWYWRKRTNHIKAVKQDLERAAQLHPQYKWLDLRDRVSNVYTWVWSAWSQQKMDLAAGFCTHWYWQNQQLKLAEWERNGLENVCSLKRIMKIEPLLLNHEEGGDGSRVVFSITAEVTDYLVEKATGRVVEGDKKVDELETIWTMVWDDGEWKLNLIEAMNEEGSYLGMPCKLPASIQLAPQNDASQSPS